MCNKSSYAYVIEVEGENYGYVAKGQRFSKNLASAQLYVGSHSARQKAYQLARRLKNQIERINIYKVKVEILNGE